MVVVLLLEVDRIVAQLAICASDLTERIARSAIEPVVEALGSLLGFSERSCSAEGVLLRSGRPKMEATEDLRRAACLDAVGVASELPASPGLSESSWSAEGVLLRSGKPKMVATEDLRRGTYLGVESEASELERRAPASSELNRDRVSEGWNGSGAAR